MTENYTAQTILKEKRILRWQNIAFILMFILIIVFGIANYGFHNQSLDFLGYLIPLCLILVSISSIICRITGIYVYGSLKIIKGQGAVLIGVLGIVIGVVCIFAFL
jgi:hypothetical protein